MLFKQIKTALFKVLNWLQWATADDWDRENLRRQDEGKRPFIYW